jgi:hypothetical protein
MGGAGGSESEPQKKVYVPVTFKFIIRYGFDEIVSSKGK